MQQDEEDGLLENIMLTIEKSATQFGSMHACDHHEGDSKLIEDKPEVDPTENTEIEKNYGKSKQLKKSGGMLWPRGKAPELQKITGQLKKKLLIERNQGTLRTTTQIRKVCLKNP